MSDFYSRSGDDGFTGLLGEGRVPKDHPRIEAIGTLDEASAALGLARSLCVDLTSVEIILDVQKDLYKMMAEIAATSENATRFRAITTQSTNWLEEKIEQISQEIENPNEFILPGDSTSGAAMAMARTIVRRAERHVAGLLHSSAIDNLNIIQYLNRLSTLCFVLELSENLASGKSRPTPAKKI